jgi:hypothetical protein
MSGHSLGTTLLAAGLLVALAAPGTTSLGPGHRGAAPADTLPAAWMAQVTMEPIRVVVPRVSALDAVTMEPIRVVIPRQDAGARGPGEESPR